VHWLFWTSLLITRSTRYRLHLGQQVPKLAVIHLNAVVRIQRDALVGIVAQFFIKAEQLDMFLL